MGLHWTWSRFAGLGVDNLYDALALRCRVFVLEQGPYLDPDGLDRHSWHLLGRDALGVLQDVHWPVGLFGYFPTYSLGNVYAGCLHAALRAALPALDQHMAKGDLAPALGWLRDTLQAHGGLRTPRATVEHATGAPVHEAALLGYLEAKYRMLYAL